MDKLKGLSNEELKLAFSMLSGYLDDLKVYKDEVEQLNEGKSRKANK